MPRFDVINVSTVSEALGSLAEAGDNGKIIAGGTGLLLVIKQGVFLPERLINIKRIKELDQISYDPVVGLRLGALCKLRDIETSPLVQAHFPLVADTLHRVANVRIRHMATLGGNVTHGDPHLDLPAVLTGLNARVVIASRQGTREVRLADFFVDYYQTVIERDELVTGIVIPNPAKNLVGTYRKFTPLSEADFPAVGVACFAQLSERKTLDSLRVLLSSVSNTPVFEVDLKAYQGANPSAELVAEVARVCRDAVDPPSDFRGSSWYKKQVVKADVQRGLLTVFQQSGVSLPAHG